MKKLDDGKLQKIQGGFSVTTLVVGSLIIAFIVGVIDGFVNPKACGGEE